MSVQAIPAGYSGIIPYLSIAGAAQAIEFYQRAFGAREVFRLDGPDGRVGHAELQIGEAHFMLADPCEQSPVRNAPTAEHIPLGLYLYVEDVDVRFAQALEAGARELMAVQTHFYGDRSGSLRDPYGYVWYLASHVEDVAPDELQRRAGELFKGRG